MATRSSNGASQEGTAFWERLYNLFSSQRRRSSSSEDEPRRRGVVVAICVLVSALLWFTFSMRETYSARLSMPTQVVNVPDGEALTQLPPSVVDAQVEGEGLSLIQLRFNPPTIEIDATAQQVELRGPVAEALKSVQLQSVSPSTLSLQKEPRRARTVPIVSRVAVETPSSHGLLGPVRLDPDSVTISGAASIVEGISAWPTRRVTFEDVQDTLRADVALADTLGGLVARSVASTTATAVSARFTDGSREIEVTVTGEPTSERLVTLDPSTITVSYRVLFSDYDDADTAADFFATVSYEQIRSDTTGRIRPQLHLPSGIELRDIEWEPSTLQYYQRLE